MATAWGLCALVGLAPLALGGTRRDAQLALALAAAIALFSVVATRLDRGARLPWPAWGPLLLVGLGLLQLLPLPTDLLTSLSPTAADLRQYALADLGAFADRGHPLSLDPAATWVAMFHQAAFAATLIAALNIGRQRRTYLVDTLIVTGGVLALIGAAHWFLDLDRIFGLYQAHDRARMRGFFSTFVNNNTLAGLLALSSCAALGVVSGTSDELRQRTARVFGALAVLGVVASASRGGLLALLLGLGMFAALAHARTGRRRPDSRREQAQRIARAALLVVLALTAAAVVVQPDWRALAGDQAGLELRLDTWEAAWRQAKAYWLTGSGRGTFGVIHPQFQAVSLNGTVTHPETIGLQLATEWGLPVAALAIGLGVGAWFGSLRAIGRRTEPEHWGLLAGLAAVSLQQVVDFGFEAAGQSIPVAVALGLVVSRGGARWGPLSTRSRATGWALLALAAGLIGLLAWRGPALLDASGDDAAATLRQARADVPALAKAAAIAHPADALVAFNAAEALVRTDAPLPEVLRWLNRAMFLAPRDHRPHLLAARALARAGLTRQAASEYHDTLRLAPWWRLAIAKEAALQLRRPGDLARVVSDDAQACAAVGNSLLGHRQVATARATMTRLIELGRGSVQAHQLRARACLAQDDDACVAADAEWLGTHDAGHLAAIYRATVAARHGDKAGALAALEAGEALGRTDPVFLRAAVQIYTRLGEAEGARASLDRLWLQVAARKRPAADHLVLRARIEAKFGNHEAALRAWRASLAQHPSLRATLGAARAAKRLGRTEDARSLLEEGLARWPDDQHLRALLDGLVDTPAQPGHPSPPTTPLH